MKDNLTNKKYYKDRLPINLAHSAFKKLHIGEEISDKELEALFDSYYVRPEKNNPIRSTKNTENLYELSNVSSRIFFPDIENELIEYFKKYPEKLHTLPPRKFEEFIASIFKYHGFLVELTPETRDGGFDIIAIESNNLTGESKYLIECKRHSPENKVGIGIVQRMLGVIECEKATKGIIATTSTFSKDAILFSNRCSHHKLTLSDYNSIKSWLSCLQGIQRA